ncbi:MAG: type II toxin-antitoxin system RelE/ParE family toxin [Betaproteobacteria bacterium]|nr:type II toxin-antitoxin system RelE/ParE family toxin [Betaproteobacteria bacterium]MDE2046832.1 type II toxin-antitoxin system RelE/ParE family toxin [Betaproteobacteria bacterium]
MLEIRHYVTVQGKDLFQHWVDKLRDAQAQARIYARIDRLALGHFGDCKTLRDGVMELRVDAGPGYRIYLARSGKAVVLLLCAGDKHTQAKDIERAVTYLKDYQERQGP